MSDWNAGVAQSVEQRTENPCVDGSIPPPGTTGINRLLPSPISKTFHFSREIHLCDLICKLIHKQTRIAALGAKTQWEIDNESPDS